MTRTGAKLCNLTEKQFDIGAAISAAPVKPFLVTLDESGAGLTVHIARETGKASSLAGIGFSYLIRRDFSRHFSSLGVDLPIRIKLHSRHALDKPRSLEAFVARFGRGKRLYDPAGVFDEAERLVGFACELRGRFKDDLRGVYWSSRWRTIYVLLNEKAFGDGYGLRRDRLIAAERSVIDVHHANSEVDTPRNVRLGFDLPAVPRLVPIDGASFAYKPAEGRRIPTLSQFATLVRVPILGALLGIGSAGVALAELPPPDGRPMLTSAMAGPEVAKDLSGNPNAIVRASSGPAAPGPQPSSKAVIDSEESIGRDTFFELARSGATFDPLPRKGRLDLRWQPDGDRGSNASTDQGEPRAFPAMQPGVAGILGLSRLLENDLSGETYGAVLKDVEAHFGLPRSIQVEARLHFRGSADSAAPDRSRGLFHRKVLLAQGESYWDWLNRTGPPSSDSRRDRSGPRGQGGAPLSRSGSSD